VLKHVCFSVNKGDFIGLIGPNGSGKSTLVKLLLGTLEPVEGTIKILGQDIKKFKDWHRIGYVSQKANSFNTSFPATVEEVVGANLYSKIGLFKRVGKQSKVEIQKALELVGMEEYRHKLIGNLSGGQQQRIFIARVLVSKPDIMFLDEPTVGIDIKSEDAVYCLLAKLNKELGISVVMVTHDISAITTHANKLACMGNGKVFMHDPTQELTEEYLSDLYGYGVKLHVHKHDCSNCQRKEVV
jgi:zinc transport system ATP-binding protein